jgi:thiazole tautomerase (transcriptional regulator TenI)
VIRLPRLHLISNSAIVPVDALPGIAKAAATGGVGAVHLREPYLSDDALAEMVKAVTEALAETDALVLLNGRPDLAELPGIGGIHLPERMLGTLPVGPASLSERPLVGVSVHSADAARTAAVAGADYVIAGHVFQTGSKPGQAGRGLRFIEEVTGSVSIPVIAIGGITPDNVTDVMTAGAYGVAVLSGILAAADPAQAARDYRRAIDATLDGIDEG